MMSVLIQQNKQIIQRVSKLEEGASKKKKNCDAIEVSNKIRYHVRLAFQEKVTAGEKSWNLDLDGPFTGENLVITRYIRTFVIGLNGDLENRDAIVNSAIKTYFESKVSQKKRKRKNPEVGKQIARNQRRIHKSHRRIKAFDKFVSTPNFTKEVKEMYKPALCPEMMSSEDEQEDDEGHRFFLVHKPNFRHRRFLKLLQIIDKAYDENCSKRSKEQTIVRRVGPNSNRSPPKHLSKELEDRFLVKN